MHTWYTYSVGQNACKTDPPSSTALFSDLPVPVPIFLVAQNNELKLTKSIEELQQWYAM